LPVLKEKKKKKKTGEPAHSQHKPRALQNFASDVNMLLFFTATSTNETG
jgi:hypothetical protein